MPMHDWTRVGAWLYHDFHLLWRVSVSRALNDGRLPSGYYALHSRPKRVAIRHITGDRVVAIIELVSPGNKDGRHPVRQFARKVVRAVQAGVHVLFVDPFPPRAADPNGLHNVVWPTLNGDPHHFPADTPLIAASYEAVDPPNCYVTPFAVGHPLPDMPVFLEPDLSVTLPLEATYTAAFADVLPMHRELLGA